MVNLESYRKLMSWYSDIKIDETFTISDICRSKVIAPRTAKNILKDMVEVDEKINKPYVGMKGIGKNKYFVKLRDVDLAFFTEEVN